MTTLNECLTQLVPLIETGGDGALARAEALVDALVPGGSADRNAAVHLLGVLQEKLGKQAKPSPLRSDVLDAIGDRILLLLEQASEHLH